MSKSLLPRALSLVIAASILTACAEEPAPEVLTEATEATETTAIPADALPQVERGTMEECPYLDAQFVAETNGQRMVDYGVDERFETPACVFWSYPDLPQATVLVREMNSFDQAMDVVDFAAPIDSTSPAEFGAWQGGRGPVTSGPSQGGSVYAVAKDSTAVVVWSNQEQSVKTETLAHAVIENLGL